MKIIQRHLTRLALAMFTMAFVLTMFMSRSIHAEELDAAETEAVLLGGPWKATDTGAVYNYWIWDSAGTLCVKANDPQSESCDDTGSWKRDGNEVCYELQWWGKVYDLNRGCYRITKVESGGYAFIDPTGLAALRFTVLASE